MTEKYVKVCPNCGSIDYHQKVGVPGGSVIIICDKCNYTSDIFPEILENQLESYKIKIKKQGGFKQYKTYLDSLKNSSETRIAIFIISIFIFLIIFIVWMFLTK